MVIPDIIHSMNIYRVCVNTSRPWVRFSSYPHESYRPRWKQTMVMTVPWDRCWGGMGDGSKGHHGKGRGGEDLQRVAGDSHRASWQSKLLGLLPLLSGEAPFRVKLAGASPPSFLKHVHRLPGLCGLPVPAGV